MKRWGVALVGALFVAVAPSAYAESLVTVNTVTVGGVGRVPLAPMANAVEADTAYHQALGQAASDAIEQAGLLVAPTKQALGPVDAISDNGGEVTCKNTAGESARYTGAEADIGPTGSLVVAVAPTAVARAIVPLTPAKAPAKRKTRKGRRHRVIARKAEASTAANCQVTSEVTVIVALET